jgi:RNA ligase (TIGR02306 family)
MFFFFGKKKDKRGWPAWVKKTDEERCQNMPWLFNGADQGKWIATEKIDGTSTTFTMRGYGRKREFYICSRNVVFDKPDKKCFYDSNVYVEMAEKYDIERIMGAIMAQYGDLDFLTIQGETYGEGIQKRDYSIKGHRFAVFNIIYGFKDGRTERLNPIEMTDICEYWGLPAVPIVAVNFELPATCDELLEFAASEVSVLDGKEREGIVLRSYDGVNSFKAVSNSFLLKYHG